MVRILEPTLLRASAVITAQASGATDEMDFDFGNLEGAFLLAVEYRGVAKASTLSGGLEMGLHFNGTQAAPGSALLLGSDENFFAYVGYDWSLTTSGVIWTRNQAVDLRFMDIVVARNIAFQLFATGASTLSAQAMVYYKRVQFTEAEIGGIVAFRR